MGLTERETIELMATFHRIAEGIRTRDWAGLVREGKLDPACVEACDVEWRTFCADLEPLSDAHVRRAIDGDPHLPLPGGQWLGVWLRLAEEPNDRAYDLVAVLDVRRTHQGVECRLYDLRVP
jgi:hypothetical protein